MESLIGEELDLNWVCCLLDDDSSPYCESFRGPNPLVNPFPTSISHRYMFDLMLVYILLDMKYCV